MTTGPSRSAADGPPPPDTIGQSVVDALTAAVLRATANAAARRADQNTAAPKTEADAIRRAA